MNDKNEQGIVTTEIGRNFLGCTGTSPSPHSSDISPCNFHMFEFLKEALGGQRFANEAGVKTLVRNWVTTRP